MSDRTSLLAALSFAFVVGCGGTVVLEEDGGGTGGSTSTSTSTGDGGADVSAAVTTSSGPSGPSSTAQATSVSSTATTSVTVGVTTASVVTATTSTSTGAGGFGEPDLYLQSLGSPADDRNQFTLSENAIGAWVSARSPSNFAQPYLERVTAPSGSIVIDGFIESNDQPLTNYGVVGLTIPMLEHPEMFPPAGGTWSVRVTQASEATQVEVLERRTVDGQFHGGALDVNVFVVPGVADPDYLLTAIEGAFTDFAGISLGDVRFFDAPESFRTIDDNNYFEAQAVSAGAPVGQAVTLLVVEWIGGSLEGAAGYSPGISADPIGHGSPASTLVWLAFNDGFYDPQIVRHETGHYAGLFHTTESWQSPGWVDPLDDTPTCPGISPNNYWECADWTHTMFFSLNDGDAILSPRQVDVIRGSALYRGIYAEGQAPAAPWQGVVGQGVTTPRAARSLALDGAGSSPSAPGGPTPRAILSGLAPEIAALEGAACGTQGPVIPQLEDAARVSNAGELVDLALDSRVSAPLRMRALLAAGRTQDAATTADDLATIALDAGEVAQVRAGAISALRRAVPTRLAAITPALRADASALVRHLAK